MAENRMDKKHPRDIAIDIVRTIAIVIMIGANLASLFSGTHSLWFRALCSAAAPLFIALAGMFAALPLIRPKAKETKVSYFIKRGLFLLLCGAFLDAVVYQEIPFLTMDVLYLIGVGLPLAFLVTRLSVITNVFLIILLLVTTLLLQQFVGYHPEVMSLKLTEASLLSWSDLKRIMQMWLVDGWFPLFPWLSYMCFGVILAKKRFTAEESKSFITPISFALCCLFILLGIIMLIYFKTPHFEREGYIELFYPAAPGFVILSFGVIILTCIVADAMVTWSFWRILLPLGQASLFVYITHSILISVTEVLFKDLSLSSYLLVYAGITIILLVVTTLLKPLKRKYPYMPVPIKWLIGS